MEWVVNRLLSCEDLKNKIRHGFYLCKKSESLNMLALSVLHDQLFVGS
jgi:hypothetical protein